MSYRDRDTIIRLGATMNDTEMAKALGCSAPTIRYWRDRHGLPRSRANPGGSHARWTTNQDYFTTIDTPEKAYILGFIIADGYVHKNGRSVSIAVKESDSSLLLRIAKEMGCNAPLYPKVTRGYGNVSSLMVLNLSRRKLVDDLAKLGVHANKSLTVTFPTVPRRLERHLVRGLWDGDGWVGERQFSLIGSPGTIAGVAKAIERHTGQRLGIGASNGHPRIYGGRKNRAVLEWIYSDSSISLERKMASFRLHWSQAPRA